MTLYLVQGGRYHRRMASPPSLARRLTLSEVNADYPDRDSARQANLRRR